MSDDITYIVKNSPIGTFKIYNGHNIGLDDSCILEHLNNKEVVNQQIQRAIENEFFIEAISLRIQILDFWLRVFIRNRDPSANVMRIEFGNLLKLAKKHGLNDEIYNEIKTFNNTRIKAIHGFLLGKTILKELMPVTIASKKTSSKLTIWVLENSGEIIHDIGDRYFQVGDMILDWKRAIANIKATTF
ncbi:hypothetical protein [Enterobacter cloacae]|uniref:hypothetical protein n=1 Tax=Enterobacter cloacae TaxID=550 RepID=UPI0032AF4565|nr:hypothetical protein [Enterobacter cloacae]